MMTVQMMTMMTAAEWGLLTTNLLQVSRHITKQAIYLVNQSVLTSTMVDSTNSNSNTMEEVLQKQATAIEWPTKLTTFDHKLL